MSEDNDVAPTMLPEDEESLGEPSFEMWVREGKPVVSGSYFRHPPLVAVTAEWDSQRPSRLLVTASDGSRWYADDVPSVGSISVCLLPLPTAPDR